MAQLNTRIVLRNDTTAAWLENAQQVLVKGEIGIEFNPEVQGKVMMKVGDGTKTWAELPYFGGTDSQVHQSGSFDELPKENLNKGDIGIVKALISGDKYSHTAYVWNGEAWAAMDGNYNANNVYFNKNLMITKEVGYITLKNGQGEVPAQGKNLEQVFEAMFVKEQNPSTSQPSVAWNSASNGSYEVGTKVTPSWNVKLNPGSYTYGPATGVTASAWAISNNITEENSTEATGTFQQWTVADGKTYKITAQATHNAGAVPLTNKGNEYAAGKIQAGQKSATTSGISGYRNSFYGTMTEKSEVNGAAVRKLTASGKALANGAKFAVTIPVGAQRVVIAYPATLRDVNSITDRNGLGAAIASSFKKVTVSVEGADGYQAIDYKVYTMDFASPNDTPNFYDVTI